MIKVEQLSKHFPEQARAAVHSVSFEALPGMITCLIGTSGCGKTTTLKMINRLVEPSQGRIWIQDQECRDQDLISWRRRIGYVIQKIGLFPHLTVQENIGLLSRYTNKEKTWIKERSEELLLSLGLEPKQYAQRYPHELSGGQQQRVGIARALMEDPPILLMDEPFGALDPMNRELMHTELLKLNEKMHKTILMVTHDMPEAFKLAGQLIFMDQGQIVQQGKPQDFLDNPVNQFVQDFIRVKH